MRAFDQDSFSPFLGKSFKWLAKQQPKSQIENSASYDKRRANWDKKAKYSD